MHPQIQQRVDGLNAMRARTHLAIAEFYAMIGKKPPAQKTRYQAVAKSANAWHIVEISTGKVVGFRFSYREAAYYTQQLESHAAGVVVQLSQAVLQ
jgi:hypothetical protein